MKTRGFVWWAFLAWSHGWARGESNMNVGGVPYRISSPGNGPAIYSTNFRENAGHVESFDVYGEIRTRYSETYWTRNAPIPLPPQLVERFKGKTMAITGYEIDQVVHYGPSPPSSGDENALGGFSCYPKCNGSDTSVPIYHAYNHHYFAWLQGADSELIDLDNPVMYPNPTSTTFRSLPNEHGYPTNIVFKENPGGEYRKSYHGYPRGFVQLVHSPTNWIVEPMQIDTHNRNFNLTDTPGYKPYFLPKAVQNGTVTDLTGGLSPLIECPCSSRITKTNEVNADGSRHDFLVYKGEDGEHKQAFEGYNCFDEPRSDMKRHGDGTGRNVSNAACSIETYHGGVYCCRNGMFLTDWEQRHLIPNEVDIYWLKWRYYFAEYKPAEAHKPASHKHMHHWVFLIDQQVNDYEEDNADYGTRSIGQIEAHLQVKDMGIEDAPTSYNNITFHVITPHCHAPSCIRAELWNVDTGELICSVDVDYPSEANGDFNEAFNEANYVAIPPCIFGSNEDGLQPPPTLSPDTNVKAIKYFNNTFRHLGQMAQWTGLLTYDTDQY